ncbi:MAG: SUMF1/EgtB/PvdO family nonheme iron enzyme [Desulfobacterales bacterium]
MALCAGAGRGDLRVLRGGSWNNNRNNARCSYRNRNKPNNRNDNNGFRVVVSHIFPHSTGNAGRLWLDGRGMKDGATGHLAESRISKMRAGRT